jgi:glycosidase
MAMGFLLTTRGIPMMYYGTEILMTGREHEGHGHIREDFPGGWKEDSRNAFSEKGRTDAENDMYDFIKRIADWRKSEPELMYGKLTHFVPENGVYVYFRQTEDDAAMIVLNNNPDENKTINLDRFSEVLKDYKTADNIINGEVVFLENELWLEKKSVTILDLHTKQK